MSHEVQHSEINIDDYIDSLSWSSERTDLEKTLVAGNLQALHAIMSKEIEEAKREAENWKQFAAQQVKNADYYHGIVTKIGEYIGKESYISDDGSVQDNVLAEKVIDLVKKYLGEFGDWTGTSALNYLDKNIECPLVAFGNDRRFKMDGKWPVVIMGDGTFRFGPVVMPDGSWGGVGFWLSDKAIPLGEEDLSYAGKPLIETKPFLLIISTDPISTEALGEEFINASKEHAVNRAAQEAVTMEK